MDCKQIQIQEWSLLGAMDPIKTISCNSLHFYTMSPLQFYRARRLSRTEILRPLQHAVTGTMIRDTIKETPCMIQLKAEMSKSDFRTGSVCCESCHALNMRMFVQFWKECFSGLAKNSTIVAVAQQDILRVGVGVFSFRICSTNCEKVICLSFLSLRSI
jgi:hypothetical protein